MLTDEPKGIMVYRFLYAIMCFKNNKDLDQCVQTACAASVLPFVFEPPAVVMATGSQAAKGKALYDLTWKCLKNTFIRQKSY